MEGFSVYGCRKGHRVIFGLGFAWTLMPQPFNNITFGGVWHYVWIMIPFCIAKIVLLWRVVASEMGRQGLKDSGFGCLGSKCWVAEIFRSDRVRSEVL